MKNIHLISTDKPSKLVLDNVNNNLFLTTTEDFGTNIMKFQNIYITSSEVIKDGEYGILRESILSYDKMHKMWGMSQGKKIILTTDQELIADGVQSIDDDFLKWFVKNPSCEKVEVKKWSSLAECGYSYHITIPKEEQK